LTGTSQFATNQSRDNYKKADKSKDLPSCPKFQESVDSIDNNTASAKVALYSVDVEETVNGFAKEARCEINRDEFNSVETEETSCRPIG
jgi:hypothetical protein